MKILFLNPPYWELQNFKENHAVLRRGIRAGSRWPFTFESAFLPDKFKFGQYTPFPHFLSHAASYTQKLLPEADVVVRDSVARGESYQAFQRDYVIIQPDWIVLETATASLEHDLRIIKALNWPVSPSKWILCGPIDETRHQHILKDHSNVHAIVKGEYDKQVAMAIRGQRGIYEHDLLSREEMLVPPFPLWDEEAAMNYWDACPSGNTPPQLQMWTSRGCPFKCCFCVFPATMTGNDPNGTKPRSVRFHSPKWVENYIYDRLSKHKFSSIYLDDDTFNLNNNHTLEICKVMKRIGLPWSAMCRADTIPQETWQEMHSSGCFGVKLGFESGSQRVIDHIVNKKLDLKKAFDTAVWLQKEVGISVHGTFTVGLPGEKPEEAEETLRFIGRLYNAGGMSTHQLSGTATIEGTPLSHIAHGEHLKAYDGAIADENFLVTPDGQMKIEALTK
jgi:radical SAM superfamily enzyme YgiQ (UPF0313 family)